MTWLTERYGAAFAAIHGFPKYSANDKVLKAADALLTAGSFSRIVAMTESDVMRAAALRERHGIPGLLPNDAVYMRDKSLMKERAAENGIPVPRDRKVTNALEIADFIDQVGYPVVLKPFCGAGSMNTHVIESEQELDRILEGGCFSNSAVDMMRELLLEEFVHGEQYHINGFYADGQCHFMNVGRYVGTHLDFLHGRHLASVLLDAKSELSRKIVAFSRNLLEKALPFGPDGMFYVEIFESTDGTLVMGEVGARIGGLSVYEESRLGFGVDFKMAAVRAFCGRGVPQWPVTEELQQQFVGHVVFSPQLGFLEEIPHECPFDWVLDYQASPAGRRYSAMRGTNGEVATIIVGGENEKDVQQNLVQATQWFYDNTKWSN
ncbi:acetyl-CoA carboxylase biotin carboxylase subunit family protein [Streptomyces sp. AP-93]|uniref:ATP-grasp domain-containing protein n=1 Tax=Streptomyces sp. AP-93 TaxID=2929048 RepID=UPI001FAF817B|nr:ATP-grasp domain-containing protein [Streptomyces sp. AP-93]MCJ0875388.1 ATP-grasp domain-containing protein [Streptomyces sp. AP-93]